jgi:hypothetical protein
MLPLNGFLKTFHSWVQSFIQASGLVEQSARRVLPKWIRYCHERPQASSDEADAPFVPGPVKGEIPVSLGDFAALSYTWGEEKNPASIFLNGTRVLVTENLEIVLRTLATNGEEWRLSYRSLVTRSWGGRILIDYVAPA